MRHGVDLPPEHSAVEFFRPRRIIRRDFEPDDTRRSRAFLRCLAFCLRAHVSLYFDRYLFVQSYDERTFAPRTSFSRKFSSNKARRKARSQPHKIPGSLVNNFSLTVPFSNVASSYSWLRHSTAGAASQEIRKQHYEREGTWGISIFIPWSSASQSLLLDPCRSVSLLF